MSFFERKIGGKIIFDGKILKLEVDEVELPDGVRSKRECIRHHGGAAVLYVTENDEVLLVKQFRYLYGKEIYEIPAGKLEKGENPAEAAIREFKEETGYIPQKIQPFLTVYPTPGYTDEVIYIFKADDCIKGKSNPDDGEFLTVCPVKIDKAIKMIECGEICDAKTVAAIYKYLSEKK